MGCRGRKIDRRVQEEPDDLAKARLAAHEVAIRECFGRGLRPRWLLEDDRKKQREGSG